MTGSQVRQVFYAAAAVVGLVLTWYFNLSYRGSESYLRAWFANAASSSAAVDLIVVAVVCSVFMLTEGRRLRMRLVPLFVVAGFVVAMACALPLFMLYRERVLTAATPAPPRARLREPRRPRV